MWSLVRPQVHPAFATGDARALPAGPKGALRFAFPAASSQPQSPSATFCPRFGDIAHKWRHTAWPSRSAPLTHGMLPRFVHTGVCVGASALFGAEWYSAVWIDHSWYIHSSADGFCAFLPVQNALDFASSGPRASCPFQTWR